VEYWVNAVYGEATHGNSFLSMWLLQLGPEVITFQINLCEQQAAL